MGIPASELVESIVPTLRMSPGGSMASRPAPQARQRAEERKRRGSRFDQLHPMQLSGAGCDQIYCNIVAFNATVVSIAWSGCV